MTSEFDTIISTSELASHSARFALTKGSFWLHFAASLITAAGNFTLAVLIAHFAKKRPDIGVNRIVVATALFLVISGIGRLITSFIPWNSLDATSGVVDLLIAAVTVATAFIIFKQLPYLLSRPSRANLAEIIIQLEHEIIECRLTEQAQRSAHADLELRVMERTAELYNRNRELYAEIIDHNRVTAALRETELVLSSAQRLALSNAGFNKTKISSDLLALLAESHPFPTSAIYLQDRRDGCFKCVAMHGMPCEGLSGFQIAPALLAEVAENGKTVTMACHDVKDCRTCAPDALSAYVEVLIVPVMFQEHCLSILILAGTQHFAPSDVSFVESLRVQLGVAQHNLQLFADCKRLADQLHIRNIEIAEKNLQLEKSSRIKSEFVANMSHELRTPLNAVLGFTGTLLMQLPGPLTPDQAKQLRTVQSSARHLLSLINDLLDVEKIESGKLDILLEDVVLQTAIREVFDTLEPLATRKRLEFRLAMPQTPIVIHTDRRALCQIVINLLNNAIKFTEAGEISIRLSRRRAGLAGTVEVVVSDSGIGIPPERQSYLFRAFTQLDASSTRRFDGTGLGLYLSQRLARLVGGDLRCKSVFGKGSVFTLALPVQAS